MILASLDLAEEFAQSRSQVQQQRETTLYGSALYALRRYGQEGWYSALLERATRLMREQYHEDTGRWTSKAMQQAQENFRRQARASLEKTKEPTPETIQQQARALAASLSTAAVNAALETLGEEAPEKVVRKVWVSMEDERVRPTHRLADGQIVDLGDRFAVGEGTLAHPGDMSGPVSEWINCRCIMALVEGEPLAVAAAGGVNAEDGRSIGIFALPAETDAVEQHPEWTPHVTLGYPDSPGDPDFSPQAVTFDRLAVWVGDSHYEYPLGGDMDDTDDAPQAPSPEERLDYTDEPIPFWGVLAPEGEESGDGRMFTLGALRVRPLPLPLAYQKVNLEGHDGSFRVANIERAWRRDGQVYGSGHFLTTVPEVEEVIGVMAESGGRMGVSIDADDGEMALMLRDGRSLDEAMEAMGEDEGVDIDDVVRTFTSARVCGATLCNIPAFYQAFIALGDVPEEYAPGDGEDLVVESRSQERERIAAAISEKSWDGSASRFTPEEWFRSTVVHRSQDKENKSDHSLPIREPNGDLSRAGVHAAAARLNQVDASAEQIASAREALRRAYSELGEEPPESLAAAAFVKTEDGPGWLTHPVDTDRLRDYWVRGKGAAKIGWGAPGDFNRCRTHLAPYVKPQHLSGYCANRHYDALGFWPGQHHSADNVLVAAVEAAEAVGYDLSGEDKTVGVGLNMVAAGEFPDAPPREWFEDPGLVEPSRLTITDDGRIFGHLAAWGTCHIGFDGQCVTPPESAANYAYFRTGDLVCADGSHVAVGQITMDTGHANLRASARSAVSHYDNTGLAVADVAVGEDAHGIYVAGAIRPGTPLEKVTALRAAGSLSGDWRRIGQGLELVAALAVNVPGFPIPSVSIAASGGVQNSLVAAGVLRPSASQSEVDEAVDTIVARVLDRIAQQTEAERRIEVLRASVDQARSAEAARRIVRAAARHNRKG